MYKESIIIILCLLLNVTVFANTGKNNLAPINSIDPLHERFENITDAIPLQPSFKKPISAVRKIENGFIMPSAPVDYFCDTQDYTNGVPEYVWSIPGAYNDDLMNMRFTSESNYDCTLKVAYLLMYALYQTGDPDLRVYLWDDDGFGFPGNKIDSIDIINPGAGLEGSNSLYWVTADFSSSNYIYSDGEEYHIGFTPIINSPSDTLWIVSDNGTGPFSGEERASELFDGTWGTMLNDWNMDISFFIFAERCCSEIPYSECHSITYCQNISYYWRTPNSVYGDSAYAQRFTIGDNDTLKYVDFAVYDDTGQPGATGIFGNNDIYISVYDDLYGLPNNLIIADTISAGTYAPYPAITTAYFDTVLQGGEYHIAFSTNAILGSGEYECLLSSDGSDGVGRSSTLNGNVWQSMFSSWGVDCNFYINPYICIDPLDCDNKFCGTDPAYLWRLPDQYGDVGQAQKFSTDFYSTNCHIRDVAIMFYWSGSSGLPTQYTYNTDISINTDINGLPGPAIATVTLSPADYNAWGLTNPGVGAVWIVVNFDEAGAVEGDYWITVNSLAPTPETGIRLVSDDGGGSCIDSWAENWGGGDWHLMSEGWAVGNDWAMMINVEECCMSFPPPQCSTPMDWSTLQGSYYRSGATQVTVSDSWCDFSLKWNYHSPNEMISFTGPVTYDNRVVCSFTDKYRVFDYDGNLLYTYIPQAGPFNPGDIRCAPTITEVVGYPDPIMFVSGGTNQEVHAVNFNTGNLIWSRDINSVGIDGMFGNTRWGVFTLLNINGSDCLFWGTDDGFVVGVDALTGVLLPNYPVDLSQGTWVSGSTDGTNLFYATRSTAVEGDVYSIEAVSGNINWQLSATDGLQGSNIYTHENGYNNDEGFTGGVAYDYTTDMLYFNSRAEADYPTDGLFYSVYAGSGSIQYATIANRVLYSTPVVDENYIYMTSFTRWASPPANGDLYALNKWSGGYEWSVSGGPDAFPYYNSAVLSCESEAGINKQLFAFTYDGFLQCISTYNGDELWRRRIDDGSGYINRGMAGALSPDNEMNPYLFFGDLSGNLYCLNKGENRPRLEIQTYNPSVPVEFGSSTNLFVTIENVFANTGCATLHCTDINVDTEPFGVDIPNFSVSSVKTDFMNRASSIADNLSRDAYLSKYIRPNNILIDNNLFNINNRKKSSYSLTAGVPSFLNSVVFPTIGTPIEPNDTADLVLDVIQANITRGPQTFYLQLCTDDPDFFLNDTTLCPELKITIVGGCLIDTSTLYFGINGVNEHLVSNTGRLGTGDWGDGPAGYNCFLIDGNGTPYYQGAYAYGVSQYEIATNSQDWLSGGGENDAFISLQPDQNWCDNNCKPFLDAGLTLGYITHDGGVTYDPIIGNIVCKSFIDSVQNFDLGLGWDWENFNAPFDNNLTMGLYTNSRVIGAIDVPELANVSIEIMEITERNGDSLNNWYLMEYWDCDNGNDTVAIDRNISSAWAYNPVNGQAWGQIKIPFGCGYNAIINTIGLYGQSGSPGFGFWGWGIFWDSAYAYMSGDATPPSGSFSGHYSYNMSSGDGEAMVTIASHNFTGNDTYKVGIAHFGQLHFNDPTTGNELSPLAVLVNQWCGFGRGDCNNDGLINLADIIYMAKIVDGGPGATPFAHLSDVDNDGDTDIDDVQFMIDYYFNNGNCPAGDWIF